VRAIRNALNPSDSLPLKNNSRLEFAVHSRPFAFANPAVANAN